MKVKKLNGHIGHIIAGYRQQQAYYMQMLDLTKRLQGFINAANVEELEKAIALREEIIENIKGINNNISLHKEAVKQILHLKEFSLDKVQDLIYPQLRADLNESIKTLEKIIKGIAEVDRQNREALEKHKTGVSQELRKIRQHHEVQQTYLDRPEMYPEPVFFDKTK